VSTARLPRFSVYYPRSFLKLIIVGFILVALPLILAIGNNALSIHEIAARGQRTVQQAMQATEGSRLLIEQLTVMERSVRQAGALGDSTLLEGYEHARSRFLEGAERMAVLHLDAEQVRQLGLLRLREADLHRQVRAAATNPEQLVRLMPAFQSLESVSEALSDLGNNVVEREVASLHSTAEGVQRFVFWQLAALVPVALVLVVAAIILISRPIAQIDAAIRRMGEGNFATRVEVSGPEDLQRLGRQLDWMRLRLVELEEDKRRFLHHVSHELKTPLAALKEGTSLLDEQLVGPLTPAQKEVAGILRQNTHRMQELIEGLLHYQEAQFRRPALAPTRVALPALFKAVVRQYRLTMASKGIRLAIDSPDIHIHGDPEKLAAVVGNLVSNAIKFSPRQGRVNIVASEADGRVRIVVTDEGPGIPLEERGQVFEPFFQGSAPHDGPVKGTGLGLSIVQEFVIAHGGRVSVLPSDTGTHIAVDLPREPVAKAVDRQPPKLPSRRAA
jgi:two-component system sensor histidine kinase GlrK